MKISSKTIYGLQFLIRLAIDSRDDWMQLKEVVFKENISEKYLESIVSRLKNSDILAVKRGAHGGYKLAKKPKDISLRQVVQLLEGVDLTRDMDDVPEDMNTSIRAVAIKSIKTIERDFFRLLDNQTLQILVDEAENYSAGNDFVI